MYYRTPANFNPILPREEITPTNIADNFDERTVINDDLNMNGYFIYNLKDPEDDQDAVIKIYVDTKQYNIKRDVFLRDRSRFTEKAKILREYGKCRKNKKVRVPVIPVFSRFLKIRPPV